MATERRQLEAAGPSGRARGRASRAAGPSHVDLKSHSLHLSCGRAGKGAEYPSQFIGRCRTKTIDNPGESVMNLMRALAASIFSACILANGASAQTYPDRPVTMLVAIPPGGADDATARIIQDPMQDALGQPIVIENVGGAGGTIAAA